MGILRPDEPDITSEKKIGVDLVLTDAELESLLQQNVLNTDKGALVAKIQKRSFLLNLARRERPREKAVKIPIRSTIDAPGEFSAAVPPGVAYELILTTEPHPSVLKQKEGTLKQGRGKRIISQEEHLVLGIAMQSDASRALTFNKAWCKTFQPYCDVLGMPEDELTPHRRLQEPYVIGHTLLAPPNGALNPHLFVVVFAGKETVEKDEPNLEMIPTINRQTDVEIGDLFGLMKSLGMHRLDRPDVIRRTTGIQAEKPIAAFHIRLTSESNPNLTQTPS